MVIPVLALPLLFQITVADGVPNWDVTPNCRAASANAKGFAILYKIDAQAGIKQTLFLFEAA